MMNIFFLLLTSLFNQDTYLVKQGSVEVPLGDLDAYVYMLGETKRGGFSDQNDQIEKNIYTLLNVNIVYQYVLNSDLKYLQKYQEIITGTVVDPIADDDEFLQKLGLDKDKVIEHIRDYQIKIAVYKATLEHLRETQDDEQLAILAKEKFLINQGSYRLPEKRNISAIVLNLGDENAAIEMVTNAKGLDEDSFHQLAVEHSVDPSKTSNSGNWGEYRKERFTFAFADQVFQAPVGVIPQVFQDSRYYYIFRVNEVQHARQQTFEEVKDEMIEKLKGDAVVRQFQNIINTQAINKMEVNPELVAHVFERYKVFAE